MKITAFLLCCVAALAQTRTPAATAGKSALDKATLEAYLRYVELWLPQVSVKIDDAKPSAEMTGYYDVWVHATFNGGAKDQLYYVSKDGQRVVKGDVYNINRSPFQANVDKLKADHQPAFGAPAGAPVTIYVFSDFECPICKEEAQILRQNVAATFPDKVRVVFNDFPLDAIHPWARTAAIAGRCIYKQNPATFWDFFDWTYDNQTSIGLDNINSKLQTFANQKGLDGMQLARCIDTKATEAEVDASIAEGRMLQVSATPTIFLNGRRLEGAIPWEMLEQLIKLELDHQTKTAATADEKCCEVTIPKLGK